MTLEQLRIFIAVAEKQHVTQAAQELNLTQSATSAAVAALEARYDIKLFDRVGRGIVLTETGRTFLNEARAVLARSRNAEEMLNDLAGLKRGSLTIAASQTVGNYWLPSRIQSFQAAYPHMVAAGGGKVINIGSVMTWFGAPHAAPYAASKGAISQFTKATAAAWAKDAIQCNCVMPGWIDTELTEAARSQVPGLNEMVLARTPAGRWGVPADLAGIAVFLAAPASDFVTGADIPCDGGYMSRG